MGAACQDEGENLGLHGVVSNIPASEVCPRIVKNNNDKNCCGYDEAMEVSGQVKESQVFGEHVVLTRKISLRADKNIFTIDDTIENLGFERTPFMLLYHMNFGFPMLSPACEILLPSVQATPRDPVAVQGLSNHLEISDPVDGFEEQVFFHDMAAGTDGRVHYMLVNSELELAVEISYPAEQLTHFTQWKCMRSGEYVLGLEPGNCHVMGRNTARKDGSLKYLEPGQLQNIRIEVQIHKGAENIKNARVYSEGTRSK